MGPPPPRTAPPPPPPLSRPRAQLPDPPTRIERAAGRASSEGGNHPIRSRWDIASITVALSWSVGVR